MEQDIIDLANEIVKDDLIVIPNFKKIQPITTIQQALTIIVSASASKERKEELELRRIYEYFKDIVK